MNVINGNYSIISNRFTSFKKRNLKSKFSELLDYNEFYLFIDYCGLIILQLKYLSILVNFVSIKVLTVVGVKGNLSLNY